MTSSDDSDNPVKAAMARKKRVTPDLKVVGGKDSDKPKRRRAKKGEAPASEPVGDSAPTVEPPTDETPPADSLPPEDGQRAKECAALDPNDRDNGRRLIIWFGADLLYVSGMGWLTWRGTHWQRDEGDLGARAKAQALVDKIKLEAAFIEASTVQQRYLKFAEAALNKAVEDRTPADHKICDKAAAILAQLGKKRGDRMKFAISSGNAGKTEAMLKQAASHQAVAAEDLDKDLHQFNLRSGTLSFRKVENPDSDPDSPTFSWAVEHKAHERHDRITKVAEVTYDEAAKCPRFDEFLLRMQPDEVMRKFIQVFHAYALLIGGNDAQKLVFHYGTGANGKSAFLEAIGRLAGTYRAVVSPDTLVGDGQRDGSKANSDIARLHSTRFVTVEELPRGTPLKENLIKSLTGGTRQVARFLQKEIFEFDPVFTAAMTGNDLPSVSGTDYGIWRRLLIVPWAVTIPEGERMPFGELMRIFDEERPGILNWLIAGAIRYLNEGLEPFIPAVVRAFTEEYREDRDNVGVFADSCMIREPGKNVKAGRLYTAYTMWCERNGLGKASQRAFGDRLKALQFKKKTGGNYVYLDVRLTDELEILLAGRNAKDDPGWSPNE